MRDSRPAQAIRRLRVTPVLGCNGCIPDAWRAQQGYPSFRNDRNRQGTVSQTEVIHMKRLLAVLTACVLGSMLVGPAYAAADEADCAATIKLFKDAGESATFFGKSYGYAVFPTIGKAGLGIGGAHGSGCVYAGGKPVGKSKMTQLSFGWQAGAQGYSLIMFFEDERAFNEFASGNFEFGAKASAVAITAGASAGAGTGGSGAGASGGKKDAATVGGFHKGVAPFSIIKGGLMYEAAIGGAKFSFDKL
jgi:lipid-binding SYLF domain-containing protein